MKYITTPIYYVNDIPHIGHAYTTILADIFKKYQILKGDEAYLLTGTDEHGQKIENAAKTKNINPQLYTDEVSLKFRSLWDELEINYDYFVRTTDSKHENAVKAAFEIMLKKGDIYKGEYEGHYCISCETFFTKHQLVNDIACPDCSRDTNYIKEENYFFALSKYQDRLLEWYKYNPDVIMPSYRLNEVINFVESGLNDLSITRNGFDWGVKLPKSLNDDKHVIYVWLDALLSYISPVGFNNDINLLNKYTNNMIHFVGKDILRFHAIYWPAFLMSLSINLPRRIYVHGWWIVNGIKMSKSIGNVVNPKSLIDVYGLEVTRYFLSREISFGYDGDFNPKLIVNHSNAYLSDTLGNLLNRFIGMCEKYFNCQFSIDNFSFLKSEIDKLDVILGSLDSIMDLMIINRYLEELWRSFDMANALITKSEPWNMIKNGKIGDVKELLAFVGNILIKGSLLLYPIMPKSSEKIMHVFNVNTSYYKPLIENKEYIKEFNINKIPPIFPKINYEDTIARNCENIINKSEICIDDFNKVDIRVGKIIKVNKIESSNKLLKMSIYFGEDIGTKEIISGIAQFYTPNDLIDKLVCAIINLKPSKIFGHISEGMILTSEDDDLNVSVVTFDSSIKVGSKIS